VRELYLSADGKKVAALTENRIYLIDNFGQVLLVYENSSISSMELLENGDSLAACGENWVALLGSSGITWLYSQPENFLCVSISQAGTVVAGTQSGKVVRFGVENQAQWVYTSTSPVEGVWARSGFILAAVPGENLILYFNENDNTPLWQRKFEAPPALATLSGNGRRVAAAIHLWLSETVRSARIYLLDNENSLLGSWISENIEGTRASGKFYDLRFPENGEYLAVGAFENLVMLDPAGTPVWSFNPQVFPRIDKEGILDAINSLNPSFVNSYSHGSTDALRAWRPGIGLSYPYENLQTESLLTNTGFLQTAFACLSAALDTSSDCLGENLLKAPGRGAVVYIGGNRAMWVTDDAGGIRELDQDFWENFMNDPLYPFRPGRAFYGAIRSFAGRGFDLGREEWRKDLLCLTLLGDPELRVFPLPRPPLPVSPARGENLRENLVRIQWSKTEPIEENFILYLDNDSQFSSPLVWETPENFWENWLPDGTWYWRVQAKDATGTGENSETWWFTVDTLAPSILQVGVGAGFYSATITWQTSEPSYGTLEVEGVGVFQTPLGTNHSVEVGGLSPGCTYRYRITARDPAGNEVSSGIRSFTTPRPNSPPVADFSLSPSSPKENENVRFSDRSYDQDGSVVRWYWDFGDGRTSSERNPVHIFETEGSYLVSLTVWDDRGASTTVRRRVEILPLNLPPTASFTYWPPDPNTRDEVLFDATPSADPDGSIVSYLWDFGDNSSGEGVTVRHSYPAAGSYRVTLTVLDNGGKRSLHAENLLVSEPRPAPPASELFNLPPENICWILLRSEPSSSAKTFELLPLQRRAEVVRLAENSVQRMAEILGFTDPDKAGEVLLLTPAQALPLLRLLLQSSPAHAVRILLLGPVRLVENFPLPETLVVLRNTDRMDLVLSALPKEKRVGAIEELAAEGDFETIEKIFGSLPEPQARELWGSLRTETRNTILPHLSQQTREKVEKRLPVFAILVACLILAVCLVALSLKQPKAFKRAGGLLRLPALLRLNVLEDSEEEFLVRFHGR
jgi:PKD repeat protein